MKERKNVEPLTKHRGFRFNLIKLQSSRHCYISLIPPVTHLRRVGIDESAMLDAHDELK